MYKWVKNSPEGHIQYFNITQAAALISLKWTPAQMPHKGITWLLVIPNHKSHTLSLILTTKQATIIISIIQ